MFFTIYQLLVGFLSFSNPTPTHHVSAVAVVDTIPNIAGTWYQNGNQSVVCTISQNGAYLGFRYGNYTSTGYFYSRYQFVAKEWNTQGVLSSDQGTLVWSDQIWTRYPTKPAFDLTGTWYQQGTSTASCQIQQNGLYLQFTLAQNQTKSGGYLIGNNALYAIQWQAQASVSADGQIITWNNQVWTRTGNVTRTSPQTTGDGRYCRSQLSAFYYAMQLLGTVWGRAATEPGRLSADAITDCTAALGQLSTVMAIYPCIPFDLGRISTLSSQLPVASSTQVVSETERLIRDLDQAIRQATTVTCSNGVSLFSLFTAGVNLGAAQAWASSMQCRSVPMPANIQGVIQAHLTTASNALSAYASCIPNFDFGNFSRINLGSMNSILAHTQIVGTETQLLWAVALSDCCCNCVGGQTQQPPVANNECNESCRRYCLQLGKSNGSFNGRTTCLLGVVSEPQTGCNCY
ncbi:MAG: hypothetical protein U0Y10_07700 [Spirosomataceae bacterium]